METWLRSMGSGSNKSFSVTSSPDGHNVTFGTECVVMCNRFGFQSNHVNMSDTLTLANMICADLNTRLESARNG